MFLIPKTKSEEDILNYILHFIDLLASENYSAVYDDLGYAVAFGQDGPICIKNAITSYSSTTYFPKSTKFKVTDWRTAAGGNPNPAKMVTWYKPNDSGMIAAITFDLPLNGKWSDHPAEFVIFDSHDGDRWCLSLEEIGVAS